MANVIFKTGTKAQYDALEVKDPNTLYWLHDELLLYKGAVLYGTGQTATNLVSGLMSASDKAKLDSINENAWKLTPVDASVVIKEGENGRTVGVKLSAADGNAAEIRDDGLYVPATESGALVWSDMDA